VASDKMEIEEEDADLPEALQLSLQSLQSEPALTDAPLPVEPEVVVIAGERTPPPSKRSRGDRSNTPPPPRVSLSRLGVMWNQLREALINDHRSAWLFDVDCYQCLGLVNQDFMWEYADFTNTCSFAAVLARVPWLFGQMVCSASSNGTASDDSVAFMMRAMTIEAHATSWCKTLFQLCAHGISWPCKRHAVYAMNVAHHALRYSQGDTHQCFCPDGRTAHSLERQRIDTDNRIVPVIQARASWKNRKWDLIIDCPLCHAKHSHDGGTFFPAILDGARIAPCSADRHVSYILDASDAEVDSRRGFALEPPQEPVSAGVGCSKVFDTLAQFSERGLHIKISCPFVDEPTLREVKSRCAKAQTVELSTRPHQRPPIVFDEFTSMWFLLNDVTTHHKIIAGVSEETGEVVVLKMSANSSMHHLRKHDFSNGGDTYDLQMLSTPAFYRKWWPHAPTICNDCMHRV